MPKHAATSLAAAAAMVALAGCGGNPDTYSIGPTKQCLEKQGLKVSTRPTELDFVALTALGGGMRTKVSNKILSIALAEDEEDATRIASAYRRFAPKRYPIDHVLRQQGNAVMLWALPPTTSEHATVTGCLRSRA